MWLWDNNLCIFLVLKNEHISLHKFLGSRFILYRVCFQSKVMVKIKNMGFSMRVTLCNQSAGSTESFLCLLRSLWASLHQLCPRVPLTFSGSGEEPTVLSTHSTSPTPHLLAGYSPQGLKSWTRPWRSLLRVFQMSTTHWHLPWTLASYLKYGIMCCCSCWTLTLPEESSGWKGEMRHSVLREELAGQVFR